MGHIYCVSVGVLVLGGDDYTANRLKLHPAGLPSHYAAVWGVIKVQSKLLKGTYIGEYIGE